MLLLICFQAIALHQSFLLVILVYSASHLLTFSLQLPDIYTFSKYFYSSYQQLVVFPPLPYLDTTAQNQPIRWLKIMEVIHDQYLFE